MAYPRSARPGPARVATRRRVGVRPVSGVVSEPADRLGG